MANEVEFDLNPFDGPPVVNRNVVRPITRPVPLIPHVNRPPMFPPVNRNVQRPADAIADDHKHNLHDTNYRRVITRDDYMGTAPTQKAEPPRVPQRPGPQFRQDHQNAITGKPDPPPRPAVIRREEEEEGNPRPRPYVDRNVVRPRLVPLIPPRENNRAYQQNKIEYNNAIANERKEQHRAYWNTALAHPAAIQVPVPIAAPRQQIAAVRQRVLPLADPLDRLPQRAQQRVVRNEPVIETSLQFDYEINGRPFALTEFFRCANQDGFNITDYPADFGELERYESRNGEMRTRVHHGQHEIKCDHGFYSKVKLGRVDEEDELFDVRLAHTAARSFTNLLDKTFPRTSSIHVLKLTVAPARNNEYEMDIEFIIIHLKTPRNSSSSDSSCLIS